MKNEIIFKDGRVRILQVSDPQDLKNVRPAMVRMLNKAYDTLSPDLVLFTGDNILGNHLLDAVIGNRKIAEGKEATERSMRVALSHILRPVDRRGIPFAMIYGNHDDMNDLTKQEQFNIYREYIMCLDMNRSSSEVDCDTYTIELKSEDGNTEYLLYLLDSAWQDMDGDRRCHTEVKSCTVNWLKSEIDKYNNLPSMVFLHIPVPEQTELTEQCGSDVTGSIEYKDGTHHRLKADVRGFFGEPPSVLEESNGLFDVCAGGNVKAVVSGHDHRNCFIGTYRGVDFIQTGAASFRCYGDRHTRGVRVIDIFEDGHYETNFMTYFDLCGKNPLTIVENFINADEFEFIKYCSLGASLAITVAGIAVNSIIKKYR